jgi:hypothetical protein
LEQLRTFGGAPGRCRALPDGQFSFRLAADVCFIGGPLEVGIDDCPQAAEA